jgi:hypothetical protein
VAYFKSCYDDSYLKNLNKTTKIAVRSIGGPDGVRTGHLPNTTTKDYRYTKVITVKVTQFLYRPGQVLRAPGN